MDHYSKFLVLFVSNLSDGFLGWLRNGKHRCLSFSERLKGLKNNLARTEIVIQFLSCLPTCYSVLSFLLFRSLVCLHFSLFLSSFSFISSTNHQHSTSLFWLLYGYFRPCMLVGQAEQPSWQPVYHSEFLGVPQNLLNNRTYVNAHKGLGVPKEKHIPSEACSTWSGCVPLNLNPPTFVTFN